MKICVLKKNICNDQLNSPLEFLHEIELSEEVFLENYYLIQLLRFGTLKTVEGILENGYLYLRRKVFSNTIPNDNVYLNNKGTCIRLKGESRKIEKYLTSNV